MSTVEPLESLSLRPATDEDLNSILLIEHKIHQAPWSEESFRAELTKPYSHFLVLTDDETDSKIAGYVIYWLLHEDAQILNIGVDLPFRGMGLGRRMVRHVIGEALRAGFTKLTLDVRKSNLPAIQLYQSLKFAITHVRKGFYTNGEDAYQMTLELSGSSLDF